MSDDTTTGVYDNVTRTVNFTCAPEHVHRDGSIERAFDCHGDDVTRTMEMIQAEAPCFCEYRILVEIHAPILIVSVACIGLL